MNPSPLEPSVPTWQQSLKPTAITLFIVFLITATGVGVGIAAQRGILVAAALPLSAVIIVAFRLLGPNAEQMAWAALTAWLGMTYAHTGGPIETVVFFVYVALGALGVFRSSWFLAFAWLGHIGWDFLPHQLPPAYGDLPMACMLFDGLIGVYLVWFSRAGRWKPLVPAAA